jgi:hypothetical protein
VIAVNTDSTVIIGVKFVSTFVACGNQTLVPNIGEYARSKNNVGEFKNSPFEFVVCIFYNFV